MPKEQLEMPNSALTSSSIADCLTLRTGYQIVSSLALFFVDWVSLERQIPSGQITQKTDADTHFLSHLPFMHEQVYADQQWYDLALGMIKMPSIPNDI